MLVMTFKRAPAALPAILVWWVVLPVELARLWPHLAAALQDSRHAF